MAKKHHRHRKSERQESPAIRSPHDVVKHLNQRILRVVAPEVNEDGRAQVINWVHHHLIAPVIIERDRHLVVPLLSEAATMERAQPSLERIKLIRLMLSGAVDIDEHLAFENLVPPPPGWQFAVAGIAGDALPPSPSSLAPQLVDWLHGRLTHTAQRTRLHTEAGIAAILAWTDSELIVYALGWFQLEPYLGTSTSAR